MTDRVIRMVSLGIRQFSDPYYQGFAAQLSFYIMLSLVPTVIMLSQILGIMDISLEFLAKWVDMYIAPSMAGTVKQLLRYKPAVTSNIVMIVMAIWAASRAQFSLMRIANYTYTDGRTTGQFFRERIRAVKTMAIMLFTIAFVIIILIHGPHILKLIFGKLFEGSMFDLLWTALRWPVMAIMYFLMVSYVYYVLPYEKLHYNELIPGSLFASVGMLVVTAVYSLYTTLAVNNDILYGSLSSIVVLMMWFYFISWVLCLGILVNKVWKDTREIQG
ncbi:MAG: YihY/virulence factor BrkB family protein [Firmicutes bacterium]|nr:YihY/virulence factor BrkB family protein [Bacillota bacterium]